MKNSVPKARVAVLLAVAGAILVSCSGTVDDVDGGSAGATDGGHHDAREHDATVDRAVDASLDTAIDTGIDAPSDVELDSISEDAHHHHLDASGCELLPHHMCIECCKKDSPVEHHKFIEAELTCACTGSLCDNSAGPADSGDLGSDACGPFCAGTKGPLTRDCDHCLNRATGRKAKRGPCFNEVEAACKGVCDGYLHCIERCPTLGPG